MGFNEIIGIVGLFVAIVGVIVAIVGVIVAFFQDEIREWLGLKPKPPLPTSVAVPAQTVVTPKPAAPVAATPSRAPANPAPSTPNLITITATSVPFDMIRIPAGEFIMGNNGTFISKIRSLFGYNDDYYDYSDEKPQHTVNLNYDYWIGKTTVTNAEWRVFMQDGGYTTEGYWTKVGWQWRTSEEVVEPEWWSDTDWNGNRQPVVGISFFEAVAYATWLSQKSGITFRLPTEAEWEKAARGTDGRIYPWGNVWEDGVANTAELGMGCTIDVGSLSGGESPYGVQDMAGNVWEWLVTKWQKPYPYQIEATEWSAAYREGDHVRCVRGGAWYSDKDNVRAPSRLSYRFARYRNSFNGLRLSSSSLPPKES